MGVEGTEEEDLSTDIIWSGLVDGEVLLIDDIQDPMISELINTDLKKNIQREYNYGRRDKQKEGKMESDRRVRERDRDWVMSMVQKNLG